MGTVTTFVDKASVTKRLGTEKIVAQAKIDFSKTNVSASDVVQCLKIPANALVDTVSVIVVTPEGATATATVGDAAGASAWDASTNLNATAGTVTTSLPGTDAYATAGKFYTAEDTIDLVVSADLDTAVVLVIAEYKQIEQYA